MSIKLKGCPFHESDGSRVFFNSNGVASVFVECSECGASGPTSDTEEGASDAWNFHGLDSETVPMPRELAERIYGFIWKSKDPEARIKARVELRALLGKEAV